MNDVSNKKLEGPFGSTPEIFLDALPAPDFKTPGFKTGKKKDGDMASATRPNQSKQA